MLDSVNALQQAACLASIEICAPETARLYLPEFCARLVSRPFNKALRRLEPETGVTLTVAADDQPGSDEAIPIAWTFPLKDVSPVQAWLQARGGSENPRILLPDWLEDLYQPPSCQTTEEPTFAPTFFREPVAEELLPYQRAGIEFGIRRQGRLLLADDMGLGKTVQAIGILKQFQCQDPILVVAPSSLRGVWLEQLRRWGGVDPAKVQVIYAGSTPLDPDASWVIVSYALLVRQKHLLRDARGRPYRFVVCDECHYVKNPEAKRSRAVYAVAEEAKFLILISGTPVLNSAMELFPLLRLLDSRLPDESTFGHRYFRSKNNAFGKSNWAGPQRELELHTYLFHKIGIRRKKEDVLKQLPAKRRQTILLKEATCGLSWQELMALEERLFGNADENEEDFAREEVQRALKLVMKTKMRCCCDYVKDLLDNGIGKFLLFAHHRAMMDALESTLQGPLRGRYIRIDGSTNQKERPDLVEQFQNDKDCKVALLSMTAMSEGVTLTAAEAVIFAELNWTPGVIAQCEARAHRLGQENSVLVQYLLLEESATDSRCYRRLEEKHRHAGMVLDGGVTGLWEEDHILSAQGQEDACRSGNSARVRPRKRPRAAEGNKSSKGGKAGGRRRRRQQQQQKPAMPSSSAAAGYRILAPLHLGLKLKTGKVYTHEDLQRRCKGDEQKLRRLEFFISEGTKLKREESSTATAENNGGKKKKKRRKKPRMR
ncbi:Zranb3 [Symbiodinium microadriaticum]|nr:Zranb3 [Symbiodinium microadriaticum]